MVRFTAGYAFAAPGDCGAGGGFMLSLFLEDSPPGWPQHPTYG